MKNNRNRSVSRRFLLKASASAAALALLAPLGAGPLGVAPALADEPVKGGVLKLAFSADPAGFDPARGPSGMSHVVIEQIYSTLMSLDPDAKPYPDLAERYDMAPDGKSYTFYLRKSVKFHNGAELTAEDVKFTFDRLRAPNSGYSYASQVETIASVEVVDPHTVTFKLTKPTGPFLVYMAFPGSSIVPKALVESGHDLNAQPVGSGPFKFISYQPRSLIAFERNADFYEPGKPYFDAIEMHLIADVTALTNALISGTVNFSNEIPPKDWATISATPGLTGQTLEGSRYYWLLPNNTHVPLDNPKVRQAIAHALDRQAIVAGTFFGQATPITGGVIPKWNWAYADLNTFALRGDVAKAKALLAEAGHPDGFETSLTMASSFPAMMSMAPIIQANLAAVGIKATISTMEIPRYWDEVWGPSKFDMTAMYWVSPLADPDDFVTNNYRCNTGINVQKSCSPDMDAVLDEAKSGTTLEARKAAYKRQQELSLEQMPIVPLVNAWILTAHTDKLQNYKPMRTGFLKTIKDAWLAA
ncbi:ABC transporter substrate-binding protein [Labrys monachus]|uniref:Peptide/nickel transport system substrate-binding protein n=1 Tax=Labrys monachus TaxID=217067 RepID=A0ABU0FLU9_9HYPH|nr:ABC transporter substrate-binding protein [Labrys monachus]MDQ0395461.1 peptide/nickel transport system substrate-binding protein [Labrys monachus]